MFLSKKLSLVYILLIFCALFSTNSFGQQAKKQKNSKNNKVEKIDTVFITKVVPEKEPVVPFRDTIFYMYGNMGAFTAKQRAQAIESRVKALEEDPSFDEDSIKLIDYRGYLNLMYKGDILLSIDTIQAEIIGKSRAQVAQQFKKNIVESINKQRDETSWERILIQIAGVIGIIVVEYFIYRLIYYLYRRLRICIRLQRGRMFKGLFKIIDADREVQFIIFILKIVRFLFFVICLYLGLLILFKLFPNTKDLSDQLLGYVISPLKSIVRSIKDYMPDFFTIIVIIIIFKYIRKFIRSIAEKIAESKIVFRGFYPDWAYPTYNILSVILFIFMFILIFPYLPKSDSSVFQGVSVFAGLMLSLGSTSVIGNLVAGLVITYMRPFKIGDRIKMGDVSGNVVEKTALVTRIKTPKNELITIPNSNVMSAHTINYTQSAKEYGLILYTNVTISYDVPWKEVHELLMEVARATDNLSKKQKPFILQDSLSEFYVEYQLNVYVKDANLMTKVYSDLRQNTQDVFAKAGIELLSPHYRVNKNI